MKFRNDSFAFVFSNKPPEAGEALLSSKAGDFLMYGKCSVFSKVSMTKSDVKVASEGYMMLLKDSLPDEDPITTQDTTTAFPTQRTRMAKPPLPALAKEVLWYGHEKRFNESHNIPYSPFIARHQRLSASIDNSNFNNMPPLPKSSFSLWVERDLQDAKHRNISQLVCNQIKIFDIAHGNYDKSMMRRQFEGSNWFNESYDDAVIDYYDARKDQKELDSLRARAWTAGARWRHAELSEY
ncbi:hypothetical protein SBOR_4966 [Sclerotinia borealis F-4128]|uniref:Uncharacterized protein n=1 Tax=Sclerotinia borealis (strain F-4128) TaxID=1432307 RepID=W9CD09_SCLBF|nr:hypothetical protein SBOR_4966 [Sclerotinia borealis F-4128]